MRIIAYLLWIMVIVLGVSFAGLNAETVQFNYYVGEARLPLSLLLAFAFAVGGVLGIVASLNVIIRYKHESRQIKRQLKKLERAHPELLSESES